MCTRHLLTLCNPLFLRGFLMLFFLLLIKGSAVRTRPSSPIKTLGNPRVFCYSKPKFTLLVFAQNMPFVHINYHFCVQMMYKKLHKTCTKRLDKMRFYLPLNLLYENCFRITSFCRSCLIPFASTKSYSGMSISNSVPYGAFIYGLS